MFGKLRENMPVEAVQGKLQAYLVEEGRANRSECSLEGHFVLKFQEVVESFFEKKELIREGKIKDALNIKPSKLWDPRVYAKALQSLGHESILVNQVETPASALYERFQQKKVFEKSLGSPTYWETVPRQGKGINPEQLQMKQGVEPAAAFRSFSEGLRFLSSVAVIDLAVYLLLLERFGESRFNQVVSAWAGVELIRIGDLHSSHRNKLMIQTATQVDGIFQQGQIYTLAARELRYLIYLKQDRLGRPLFTEFGLNPKGESIDASQLTLSAALNTREIERWFIPPVDSPQKELSGAPTILEHFVQKMEELVTPFFQKRKLIREGKLQEAINIKPSRIWSNRIYGAVLKRLGEKKILVNQQAIPARQLHQRLRDDCSLYLPRGNRDYWSHVRKPDQVLNIDPAQLEMKRGVNFARAFTSFQEGLSFLDCHSILDVARYLVLLERWGEARFNAIMGRWMEESPIRIGDNECPHQAKLIMLVKIKKSKLTLEGIRKRPPTFYLGQLLYMKNRSDYCRRNPHGPSSGINLVYKGKNERGEDLFIGFDLDPKGVTLQEAADWLFEEYNQLPVETDAVLPIEYVNRLQTFYFEFNGKEERFTLEELYLGAEGKLKRKPEINQAFFQYHFLPWALKSIEEANAHYRTPITKEEFLSGHEFFEEYDSYELPNVHIESSTS